MNTRYVVVTPVRNEEVHIRATLDCMTRQTILPLEWVIVNDGSSDATGEIIEDYARRFSWIKPLHRKDRGFRQSGGGVVAAFNDGYSILEHTSRDFVVKFDGDLSFEPEYFEKCLRHFAEDPKLGVGGGTICHVVDGKEQVEQAPAFHVRGATKIYRQACWEQIGGFWPAPGWDTIDEVKANQLGWTTRSFPDLHLIHHRVTGTADGALGNLVKNGRANYVAGYHPLFMLFKCVKRLIARPRILGSGALLYGYLTGYLKRIPQVDDPQMIRYLRRQQMNKLLLRETVWR
jgi:glycosyltransferase involved in cell wall biosynthesis